MMNQFYKEDMAQQKSLLIISRQLITHHVYKYFGLEHLPSSQSFLSSYSVYKQQYFQKKQHGANNIFQWNNNTSLQQQHQSVFYQELFFQQIQQYHSKSDFISHLNLSRVNSNGPSRTRDRHHKKPKTGRDCQQSSLKYRQYTQKSNYGQQEIAINRQNSQPQSSGPDTSIGIVSQMNKSSNKEFQTDFITDQFKFEVVEFFPDGEVVETYHTPTTLGLNPRDISLFAHNTTPQRAAIAVRNNAILFRSELCRAIVFEDRAVLFPCELLKRSVEIAESIHARITYPMQAGEQVQQQGFLQDQNKFLQNGGQVVPFELRVLEALLDQTSLYFENKSRRLGFLADCVVNDINHNLIKRTAFGELQRLLPVQRSINQLINDVEETRQAIEELADDDKEIVKLCLTSQMDYPPAPLLPNFPDFLLATALLDSYERRIRSVHGNLQEQLDNIESSRMIWHMQLDSARNRIIRLNLFLSVSSFAAVVATIPAGLFGMNVPNGFEESVGAFQTILTGSLLSSVFIFTSLFLYYRYWPTRFHRQRVQDMSALRDILVHRIDDLDDITAAVRRNFNSQMSKHEFANLVDSTLGKKITKPEIDVLYKVFDTNKDGFLKVSDFIKDKNFTGKEVSGPSGFGLMKDDAL
eukprot:TRINITY_DN713_c1_g1_i3.p1 TRINITY_DN713_c1_g1~~TRINITY_DN713_c1_g1_i3.p1  ORF type:complete len:659 (-),score=58.95 TRINITY_DN713_c1_g1_i3:1101-3011(-)